MLHRLACMDSIIVQIHVYIGSGFTRNLVQNYRKAEFEKECDKYYHPNGTAIKPMITACIHNPS